MSERKVLNVSTLEWYMPVLVHRIDFDGLNTFFEISELLCWSSRSHSFILEILPTGLRPVEDPAHEAVEEPKVLRSSHGTLQHAVRADQRN